MIPDIHRIRFFREHLMKWHELNQRSFPWKNTDDPYKIWLSEIILQQTRTDQGLPYYVRISEKYPDVFKLAAVEDDEFMNDWQGLGYYSRARNMLSTARWIAYQNNGIFPMDFEGLLKLKGVGEYTAAAISSFAYNQAHAVVDGNVIRVIARFFGIEEAVDITDTKKRIKLLANKLLDDQKPGSYNQAIMDFGATQCKPKKVNCLECPMDEMCIAQEQDMVALIPYKSKKIKRKNRYFHFIILKTIDDDWLVERREQVDIWNGLYQLPMIEHAESHLEINKIVQSFHQKYGIQLHNIEFQYESKQHLTHQTIHGYFYFCNKINHDIEAVLSNQMKICKDISSIALPKILSAYVNKFVI